MDTSEQPAARRESIPLVSAIIPVFNGERFLADAIESVLSQTYRPFECVVVDDGSTDGTHAVASSFGSNIRYVHKVNGGVASARNLGAAQATGSLLAFLDSDDAWAPEKLSRQVDVFQSHPHAGLIYTGLATTDDALRVIALIEAPPPEEALRNSLLLERSVMSIAQTGLVPRNVFLALGGFEELLSTSADTDLACRIALSFPVIGINEPLTFYRQHPGQMHLDTDTLERDMLLVFQRIFSQPNLPLRVGGLRRLAHGRLFLTLAAHHRKHGSTVRAFRYLVKAIFHGGFDVLRRVVVSLLKDVPERGPR